MLVSNSKLAMPQSPGETSHESLEFFRGLGYITRVILYKLLKGLEDNSVGNKSD